MVNIRATLGAAVQRGVIEASLAATLTDISKTLFYKERSWDTILQVAANLDPTPMPHDELRGWLRAGQFDQKRADALEMLGAIQAQLSAGVTPLCNYFDLTIPDITKPRATTRLSAISPASVSLFTVEFRRRVFANPQA